MTNDRADLDRARVVLSLQVGYIRLFLQKHLEYPDTFPFFVLGHHVIALRGG